MTIKPVPAPSDTLPTVAITLWLLLGATLILNLIGEITTKPTFELLGDPAQLVPARSEFKQFLGPIYTIATGPFTQILLWITAAMAALGAVSRSR